MNDSTPRRWNHPKLSRRTAVQAGAIGMLGLGINHVAALRAAERASSFNSPSTPAGPKGVRAGSARACVYIFLSGGLSQHESFDPKPDAPADVRGEFQPIATKRRRMAIRFGAALTLNTLFRTNRKSRLKNPMIASTKPRASRSVPA